MSRLLGFLLAAVLLAPAIGSADERPNVLWIVLDDLGVDVGCYGETNVSTPAIDQLAKEGVRFTQCFASAPVCSSSRSAFNTGMMQTSIGAHHHRTRKMKPLPDGVKTVMQQFREAGYFTCNMAPPGGKRKAKLDLNFTLAEPAFQGDDWSQRKPDQPFFAQVQIHEPHRPFTTDAAPDRAARVTLSPRYPDHPVVRADMANYLATVEAGDKHVGAMLKRLEDEGLADNTIVFLFGDHGAPHVWGKQWLYDEGIRVPLIVRWPRRLPAGETDDRLISLIDLAPASLQAVGITPHEKTQGVAFLNEKVEGREFIVAARDRAGDAPDRIRAIRTKRFKYIRNYSPDRPYTQLSSYKKLSYPALTVLEVLHVRGELSPGAARMMQPTRPAEELYDLNADPHEIHNLAEDDSHTDQLARLRKLLAEWEKQTGDRGATPEGDAAYHAGILAEKRTWYERTMKKRGLDPEVSAEQYLKWWEKELLK